VRGSIVPQVIPAGIRGRSGFTDKAYRLYIIYLFIGKFVLTYISMVRHILLDECLTDL
jgi:hypothetical protein